MTLYYKEFTTTQSALLADLRTHIMAGGDWTRPNAADKPDMYTVTTSEGESVYVDFADAAPTLNNLSIGVWRTYAGGVLADKSSRWLYWRNNVTGASATMPIHCVLSASSDHLYFSVEGPRSNEPGATNVTIGSIRNTFFCDTVLRYHPTDVSPALFVGGASAANAAASVGNNSFQGNVSTSYTGGAWGIVKLASLDFPSYAGSETVQYVRQSTIDGNYYLSPYVVFGDESGIRGRLANFFHAGFNGSDTPETPPPPTNQIVTYDGKQFKLLAPYKSDGGVVTWGQFGSAGNNSSNAFWRSPIVAVPYI